jgi:hypothetical protein
MFKRALVAAIIPSALALGACSSGTSGEGIAPTSASSSTSAISATPTPTPNATGQASLGQAWGRPPQPAPVYNNGDWLTAHLASDLSWAIPKRQGSGTADTG